MDKKVDYGNARTYHFPSEIMGIWVTLTCGHHMHACAVGAGKIDEYGIYQICPECGERTPRILEDAKEE